MSMDPRRVVLNYGFALICVGAAIALTRVLGHWAEPDFTALYALAVLLAASVGGLGPGLLATLLAATGTAFAQAGWTSALDLGLDDVFRLAVFVVVAVVVSSLAARQRNAEEQLRQAVTELKDADKAKDRVLAALSHELRTPLTSILGWSTILCEPDVDAQIVAEAGESIRQSARSQQILIEDLLDLSRIVFRKFRIDVKSVDLVPLVRASADLIKPMAEAKQIEIKTDLPPRPCIIDGDEQRIKQVIWNFLSNAVKFTPAGGAVNLRLVVSELQAEVMVTDTGEGIEPESLPRVFDRFQQGEGARAKGGLGLGLAIARYLVEAHHGSVAAFSAGRDTGATFVARFPLTESH